MSTIEKERSQAVADAVESGVGLAGCHGGMCDAFRNDVVWQFMTGAQWVAHPGNDGVEYRVRITDPTNPLVAGIDDFDVKTEQYYLHIDPAVKVHAVCDFPVVDGPHAPNGPVAMPIGFALTLFHGSIILLEEGPEKVFQNATETVIDSAQV
jgi:type 1 glutamine amidotransferase